MECVSQNGPTLYVDIGNGTNELKSDFCPAAKIPIVPFDRDLVKGKATIAGVTRLVAFSQIADETEDTFFILAGSCNPRTHLPLIDCHLWMHTWIAPACLPALLARAVMGGSSDSRCLITGETHGRRSCTDVMHGYIRRGHGIDHERH